MRETVPLDFSRLGGVVPAVVQDAERGDVLMVGFMNQEAWERTRQEGVAYYYSRSRRRLWKKGETSGRIQHVVEIFVDCDEDTILLKVRQEGDAACHTGHRSCFYRRVGKSGLETVSAPLFDPAVVYAASNGDEDESTSKEPPRS